MQTSVITGRQSPTSLLSEPRLQPFADTLPVLLRVTDPELHATWFNAPWLAFTGGSLER